MEPFDGETPLQAIARQSAAGLQDFPVSSMISLERFPYYTAFPFAWYPILDFDGYFNHLRWPMPTVRSCSSASGRLSSMWMATRSPRGE